MTENAPKAGKNRADHGRYCAHCGRTYPTKEFFCKDDGYLLSEIDREAGTLVDGDDNMDQPTAKYRAKRKQSDVSAVTNVYPKSHNSAAEAVPPQEIVTKPDQMLGEAFDVHLDTPTAEMSTEGIEALLQDETAEPPPTPVRELPATKRIAPPDPPLEDRPIEEIQSMDIDTILEPKMRFRWAWIAVVAVLLGAVFGYFQFEWRNLGEKKAQPPGDVSSRQNPQRNVLETVPLPRNPSITPQGKVKTTQEEVAKPETEAETTQEAVAEPESDEETTQEAVAEPKSEAQPVAKGRKKSDPPDTARPEPVTERDRMKPKRRASASVKKKRRRQRRTRDIDEPKPATKKPSLKHVTVDPFAE